MKPRLLTAWEIISFQRGAAGSGCLSIPLGLDPHHRTELVSLACAFRISPGKPS